MKSRKKLVGLLLSIVLLGYSALSYATSPLINYQGVIRDSNSEPVKGEISITFSIWDSFQQGSKIWSEPHLVAVKKGFIDVQLGAIVPFPAILFDNNELYLGIKVGNDSEMVPRQRITSAAYAKETKQTNSVYGQAVGLAQVDTGNAQSGQVLTSNPEGNASWQNPKYVPVGSIIAWSKSISGEVLPTDWVECNGQEIIDPDSPYNNQFTPDLNNQKRFLRGNNVDGAVGGSATHNHQWSRKSNDTWDRNGNLKDLQEGTSSATYYGIVAWNTGVVKDYFTSKVDSQPPYYDVVWIMRIK